MLKVQITLFSTAKARCHSYVHHISEAVSFWFPTFIKFHCVIANCMLEFLNVSAQKKTSLSGLIKIIQVNPDEC